MKTVDISLSEWTKAGPRELPALQGLDLSDDSDRRVADTLRQSGLLTILELANGLYVETTSFVGSVAVGPLRLTVQPKIEGDDLLSLLRYAFGLRNLKLLAAHEQALATRSFVDLLLHQLEAEAMELLARGLQRRYLPRAEGLSSPRGRIEFGRLAVQGGPVLASLPCRHHPRLENCIHNQVLLAGLLAGARLAADLFLRTRLRQLARRLEEHVSRIVLDEAALQRVKRESSRLTSAYLPAIRLIEILAQDAGTSPLGDGRSVRLPGFLFDMNLFWQQLVSRFLHDHLAGHRVEDQFRLRGMLAYVPGFNPQRRQAPEPRPDFVVLRSGHAKAILDAKYRDLWENSLPRDMLYQLVIYALSHRHCAEATILYPTTAADARESRIEVRDPVDGAGRATVILRPVNVPALAQLISLPRTVQHDRRREQYARQLVFGLAQDAA